MMDAARRSVHAGAKRRPRWPCREGLERMYVLEEARIGVFGVFEADNEHGPRR